MNKTRIILAATGGVLALAALVMAVLTWLAFAERTEALEGGEDGEGLAGAVSSVERLLTKKPFPSEENRRRLDDNRRKVEDWCAAARHAASRGDWCAPKGVTPAQFKEQIAADVKALLARKDPVVKPDFAFGPFKDYLADKMPSPAQLPRLQRQWYDLMSLVDVLSTNGVREVVDLQVVDRTETEAQAAQAAKGKKPAARSAAKKTAAKPEVCEPSVETYRLTFVAKPAAFAGALRELSFQDRFTVVESFGFVRDNDTIAEALGGGEKKEKAAATGRRGRRRGAREEAAKAETKEEGPRNAVVFDPEADGRMKVDLTVSVYDFHSLEDVQEGGAAK